MAPKTQIEGSRPVAEVLAAFRASVNQPGTMFSTDHWLLPILARLTKLLNDPVTEDEAAALLDVLYERHRMADLLAWLERGRPIPWSGFFEFRAKLEEEDRRKRAEERKRRRAEGLDRYLNFKLFPDDFFPKISDLCPDCGSRDWKPIAYGLPTEDTEDDARLGEVVLGGCTVKDAERYCTFCFNRWPTKPDMSKPKGRPEWIQERIARSRSEYRKLAALADLAPDPEEPIVERAWARIDGSVCFLVSFGMEKTRVTKSLRYARLGGAPVYDALEIGSYEESERLSTLAALAAVRFERTQSPERHNLYNDWDKVQAHDREFGRRFDGEAYRRERAKEAREKLSKLLKMARNNSEKLPTVASVGSTGQEKKFLIRFPWGAVQVRRYEWPLEPLRYECWVSSQKAEDSELAQDLACAAAMLAEFPSLHR